MNNSGGKVSHLKSGFANALRLSLFYTPHIRIKSQRHVYRRVFVNPAPPKNRP